MPATTYECSECGALLKSPQELPAGKKIRCPKCSKVFTVGGEPAAQSPAVAVKAKPAAVKAPPPPVAANVDDDEEGGSYILQADTAPPSPTDAELNRGNKKKRKKDDEEDDDDFDDDLDDEDKPVKKKKKKAFKQKKSSTGGGGKIVLILASVLVLFLLAGAGGGAYVYLNWYKNKGTGKEEPLAFFPSECNVVAYVNYGSLASQPSLAPLVERAVNSSSGQDAIQKVKADTGIEAKELFEQIYFGYKVTPGSNESEPPGMVVFKSKVPFDQSKIMNSQQIVSKERSGWRSYFKIKSKEGKEGFLYMPSDRFIIFTTFPESTLQSIMASKAIQPALSADLLAFVQNVEKNDVWIASSIDDKMRQQMKAPGAMPPGMMPPGIEAGMTNAKAFGLGASVSGSQVKFTATLECGNSSSAKKMSDELDGLWNKQKGMLGMAAIALGRSGSLILKDLAQSLRFSSKGNTANVSGQVGVETLKDVIEEGIKANQAMQQQQQQGGRRGNRGPGPGVPGPGGPDGPPGGRQGGFGGRRGGRDGR